MVIVDQGLHGFSKRMRVEDERRMVPSEEQEIPVVHPRKPLHVVSAKVSSGAFAVGVQTAAGCG